MNQHDSGLAPDAQSFFATYYWSFLEHRERYASLPAPVIRWWPDTDRLTEVERCILAAVRDCDVVLDVGAGDLRVKRKLEAHGLAAKYLTLDLSKQYRYDYRELSQVPDASCDAVLLLEVIEHIPLQEFWGFIANVIRKLRPTGRLVITTPNAKHVETIWAGDMTHVHAYVAADLAALLRCYGFDSVIRRIAWVSPDARPRERLRFFVRRVLTHMLQVDYARGVLLLAERSPAAVPGAARR